MNTTARVGRLLRNLPDTDVADVLDSLDLALRTGHAEPLGAGCWCVVIHAADRTWRAIVAENRGKTTLLGLTPVRGP